MLKLKLQCFGHLMQRTDSSEQTLMLGKIEGRRRDDRRWDGWMASQTRWTWVWVGSRSWCWTGKPGMLQLMGSQRVRHNWLTELNLLLLTCRNSFIHLPIAFIKTLKTINPAFPSPLEMLCLCTPKSNKSQLPCSLPLDVPQASQNQFKPELTLLKPVTTLFLPLTICSINNTESQSRKPNLLPLLHLSCAIYLFYFSNPLFPLQQSSNLYLWKNEPPLVSHYSLKSELSFYCMLLKAQIYKYIFREIEKI